MFVATKPQAQEVVAEQAARCGAFYVNNRWLGGMLTNFSTIKKSLEKYRETQSLLADPVRLAELSKKKFRVLLAKKIN